MDQNGFIFQAIQLAVENVQSGRGGPFGAVVVRDGQIVATGVNQVTSDLDPTAHAEVVAIRNACQALKNFELSGCEIYCSCEPCPMCQGAIYWSRPDRVFFAATGKDAADVGFDDFFIREQICLPYQKQRLSISHLLHERSLAPFQAWQAKVNKVEY
jgi:guanine deaminase